MLLKILLLITIFIKNLAEKEKKIVKNSFSPHKNHSSFTEYLKCLEENKWIKDDIYFNEDYLFDFSPITLENWQQDS